MFLKRLTLHGFKSFADRVVVELEPGVTGIVGPNGCGKSNIADAIKWVLGEQSPKSLRASSMQDVLFEGADTRPAMAFCEVSLLFSDCEAQLGTAFNEVEVGRRVERDGASDYYINSKACRLKDIQNLFRDTGIGRVAYSFLQQGQIDKLLSSNPVDRRTVFEEAAGISGFKVKREETLRKLTDVETNLARLSDILTEVSSQMASLKRQASKAVRAARLKRQLSALDQALIAFDLQNLSAQLEQKTLELAPLEESVAQKSLALTSQEDSLKSVEGQLGDLVGQQQSLSNSIFEKRSEREEALSHARFLTLRAEEALSRISTLEATLKALESDEQITRAQAVELEAQLTAAKISAAAAQAKAQELAAAHEAAQKTYETALGEELELKSTATQTDGQIASLRARLSALELEQHGLTAQMGPITAQRSQLSSELSRLGSERQTTTSHATVAQERLTALKSDETAVLQQLETLRSQNGATRETFEAQQKSFAEISVEHNLLTEMNRRYEGFGEATKDLLSTGQYTPLVEGLEIAPEATKALEALLSLELEAVRPQTGVAISVAALKDGQRVALEHFVSEAAVEIAAPIAAPFGLQKASEFLRTSPSLNFLKSRLEGCYVCPDQTRFEQIVNGGSLAPDDISRSAYNGSRPTGLEFVAIVNFEGAMIDGRGLFCAPQNNATSATYLTRAQRLKELSFKISKHQAELQSTKQELTRLDHALADRAQTLEKIRAEEASQAAQITSLQASAARTAEAVSRVQTQISQLDSQTENSRSRLAAVSTERAELQSRFETLLTSQEEYSERVKQISETLLAARAARDGAYSSLSEGKLAEANTRHSLQISQETSNTSAARGQDLTARITGSRNELARLSSDVADYQTQAAEKNTLAASHDAALADLDAQLSHIKSELEKQEGLQHEARTQMNALREALSSTQSTLMRLRLEAGELQTRRGMILEDLHRRFGENFSLDSLNWTASLYEADFFAKADESTLEIAAVELPPAEELAARYPIFDREQLYLNTQNLRQKLDGIGPINESALEDYQAHEARFSTLKTQTEDLHAAKTELTTALMELNAQSSTLFTTTFETVRANFGKTFEALFGGGKADLELSNPEDPLNSGIEIMARPPGTQLKSLNLLSGGQKTMTAVALLFAIYQVKPSPFCVLDELDAPLDDANIGRFLQMLKGFTQFSQFVIITHNKRTMASCNVLYGVTMQERGVSRLLSMRLAQAESYSKPAPKIEAPPSDDDTAKAAEVAASYRVAPEESTATSSDDEELRKIQEAVRAE